MLLRKVCQVPQRCQLHQLSNQGLCQALSYSHEMSSIIHFDFGCPLKETSIGLHVPFWFMIIHVPNLFMCKSMIYTALNCTLQTILIQSYIIYVYVFFSKNNCLSVFFGFASVEANAGSCGFSCKRRQCPQRRSVTEGSVVESIDLVVVDKSVQGC